MWQRSKLNVRNDEVKKGNSIRLLFILMVGGRFIYKVGFDLYRWTFFAHNNLLVAIVMDIYIVINADGSDPFA